MKQRVKLESVIKRGLSVHLPIYSLDQGLLEWVTSSVFLNPPSPDRKEMDTVIPEWPSTLL